MAEEFRVLRPREFHTHLVLKGQRADGRTLEETRGMKLETDAIRTADSSSLVKLGNTSLVCGCIGKIIKNQDKNYGDEDIIKISVELPPICSTPNANKSQNTAQLLTRTLTKILEDSDCVDKEKFYIDQIDSHWQIDVEVICLNYDGSLLDAALISILSALRTLSLKAEPSSIPVKIVDLKTIPICSSFALIGDCIICDPNLEEESVAQTTFSITIDAIKNQLCHVNKIGGFPLSNNNLSKCIQLAKEKASNLKSLIDNVEQINGNEMSIDS